MRDRPRRDPVAGPPAAADGASSRAGGPSRSESGPSGAESGPIGAESGPTGASQRLEALAPYGRALRDYHRGELAATLRLHSTLGEHDELPVAVFFRGPDEFFPFELCALEMCRGRVLDAGAGAGVHSLVLQEAGCEVVAIDVLPDAVEIMRARGVEDACCADLFDWSEGPVDTLLMLMNGMGPAQTRDGVRRLLAHARSLLSPSGQLLVDSAEVERALEPPDSYGLEWPEQASEYDGEAWIRLEYRGEIGPPFRELYLDLATLDEIAAECGWSLGVAFEDEEGGYLARLTPP